MEEPKPKDTTLVGILESLLSMSAALAEIVVAKGLCTDDELMDVCDRKLAEQRARRSPAAPAGQEG